MTKSKLSKDQLQKIVLSGMGFIVLIYVYLNFFLAPLAKTRATVEKSIEDLQGKLASSKTNISKATRLETEASAATTRYALFEKLSPEGAPIAWFPPHLKAFFAQKEIDKASARLANTSSYPEAELANWNRYSWTVELPQVDYASLGKAIAELENSEPLLYVSHVTIRPVNENPEFQQVTLMANTAILKR